VSRSHKAHILLALATFAWGATFALIKAALADISPLLFNAVRMAIAAVCLIVLFHKHVARLTRGALAAGSVVGISLWLGYEFQTTGLNLTTASKSAFLTGICVVFVPVILAIGWGRRIKPWTAAGVVVVTLGLYLLTIPAGAGVNFSSMNRGDLLTLVCAVAFAMEIVLVGWATAKYPFQQIATVMIAVCAVLMFATVPLAEKAFVTWSPVVIWALGITVLFSTVLGFTVQSWAQQFTPPTHAALIMTLEPVFAWMISYAVLHERLGIRATIGALMIVAGVLVSEMKGGSAPAAEKPADIVGMAD
jgi:drug/metabolite transporter (DMT)-like permease